MLIYTGLVTFFLNPNGWFCGQWKLTCQLSSETLRAVNLLDFSGEVWKKKLYYFSFEINVD